MKQVASHLVLVAVVLLSWPAVASPTGPVVTTKIVDIVGTRHLPSASIEVSRAVPVLTLKPLQQPAIDCIALAVCAQPF